MSNGEGASTPEPLPEQRAFIERSARSHALLVAGPGTGKTWTLSRTAEYLTQRGADPEAIAVLTLTRSMAGSLAERVPHGRASTLHSFALSLLNRIGEATNRNVADPWEQENLVRKDLQLGTLASFSQRPSLSVVDDFLDRLATAFREDQRAPADLSDIESRLLAVLDGQRELFRYRLLDELVWAVVRLLEQGAEVREPPAHVLVDEYQDLTSGELRLLYLLADRYRTRVLACGDDRQCIFGFRDADRLALHRFPEVYDLPQVDYLSRSKRCAAHICEFAEAIASVLPALPGIDRPSLRPWEGREDPGQIRVLLAPSPKAEARWVIQECRRLIEEEGIAACDVMIVIAGYRAQVFRSLREAAAEVEDLPCDYYDPMGFEPLATAVTTRLLNAGMRLLLDMEDQLAWRVLIWATRGVGDSRMTRLLTAGEATFLRNLRAVAERDGISRRALRAGELVIERFREMNDVAARDVVELLAQELQADCNVEELNPLIERIGTAASPSGWSRAIFELSQRTQTLASERPADIPVRTIFGAKGLEAEVVFLLNAIPHAFGIGGDPADGIRRLYVGVTRAKERLYITAPGYLRYTSLGHATGIAYAGLSSAITAAASRAAIDIETL